MMVMRVTIRFELEGDVGDHRRDHIAECLDRMNAKCIGRGLFEAFVSIRRVGFFGKEIAEIFEPFRTWSKNGDPMLSYFSMHCDILVGHSGVTKL